MKMKLSLASLKRIFSVLMAVLLLVSTIGIMSVSADSVAAETPVPTKIIYGPDNFVGESETYIEHNTYVTQTDINAGRFSKNLIADFNISYSSFGMWSSTSLFLDSVGSNDRSGFNFMIYGPSGFADDAKDFITEPTGVGIVLKRGTSDGSETINVSELGVRLEDFVKKEYRVIIKRIVGDIDTSVQFYMFEKNSAIPSEPLFSFTYTNEEYGSPAKSISFGSWELQELTVSDVKLYDYDADISALKVTETSELSIENPSVVPTKSVLESVTCIGEAGSTVYHQPYVTKDDVNAGTYGKYLIADFDVSFSTFGGWRNASLWLDSYDLNDWGGFCFIISGEEFFKNEAAGLIDNPNGVGVILNRSTKPGSEKLAACSLGVTDGEFVDKEYRIIIKRVVGDTDTFVEFYMFEKTEVIPSEPMFSFSYTNEEYGPASTSIGFTTWEEQEFKTSNVKLYNYDLDIITPSVEEPSIVPTKTALEPTTCIGEDGNTIYHTPYVNKDDVDAGIYSKYLIADFEISFSNFGGWKSASLWLDSYDLNDWGGFNFEINGESSFANNAAGLIDNPNGVGVLLRRSTKPGNEVIGACSLGVSDTEFVDKEYRIIIKRVVEDTDTFVEFYMFEKAVAIPSEPMFSFSYTNEEYGPASTSVGFTTWGDQEFKTSNVKLYNYNLDIRPYYPSLAKVVIGDFDGDGTVNGNDIVILRKELIEIDVSDIGTVTDLTNDGIIDLRDLVRIKKIIAGIKL